MIILSDASEFDRLYTHKFYQQNDVCLSYSKPIKKGFVEKSKTLPETGRDNTYSSRVLDGALPKAIQYYRMWFRFLKLALECEQKQIEVVISPNTYTKRTDQENLSGGVTYHVPRQTQFLTVNREVYAEWDLDDVLTQTFDKWWKSHKHLFQASLPEIIETKNIKADEHHVYLKIDKRQNWQDLIPYLSEHLRPLINQPHKYQVKGKGRSDQLTNRYNAVVCSMHGMSAKDIFTAREGYIRAPNEKGDRVDVGGSLAVTETKSGQLKYSSAFQRQYKGGIFHLLEVCEGRFGKGFI